MIRIPGPLTPNRAWRSLRDTDIGCNAVLNPGTLLGPRALVMPAMAFSGYLPPAMIAHTRPVIKLIPRRD